MKRILCHLAQRNPGPTGTFAKHVSRCRECQEFFHQVASLEEGLVTSAPDPDLELCKAILAKVLSEEPSPVVKRPWVWALTPMTLSVAVGVLLLVGIFGVGNFHKPTGVADTLEEEPVLPQPPAPQPPREMTFAYALQQQKLLQSDALKLGTHLRENLILFQTDK